MAKDDYYVLVYKILRHLYDCLKKGTEVNWNELQPNSKKFPIPESYWDYIWFNLWNEGFITGVTRVPIVGDTPKVKLTSKLQIAPKGILYLEENSTMRKIGSTILGVADLVTNII